MTKISPTPLRHVELVKFDPYGPVNAGNALGGANRQGTGVSEAAWLVKINQCDSFMWVSGFPLSIHSFSSTDCISKQRHNIVSEGEQDRPFPSLLHHYLRTVGQLCALDSYLWRSRCSVWLNSRLRDMPAHTSVTYSRYHGPRQFR